MIDAVVRDTGFQRDAAPSISLTMRRQGRFLEGTGSLVLDHLERVAYACRSPRTHEAGGARVGARDGLRARDVHRHRCARHAHLPHQRGHEHRHPRGRGGARMHRSGRPRARSSNRARRRRAKCCRSTDAEMQAFAGNVLELGTWDEYLGDMRILVMSATAQHALAARKYARLYAPWMRCSAFPSKSSSGTGVAASVVCSPKFSCAETSSFPWISPSRSSLPTCSARWSAVSSSAGCAGASTSASWAAAMPAAPMRCVRRAWHSASGSSSSTSPRGGSRRRCLPGWSFPGYRRRHRPAAWLPAACAFAAILGHVFPVWHGFRGGKGVATLVGAYAGLELLLLLPLVVTWLAVVMVSGYRRPVLDRGRARHAGLSTAAGRRAADAAHGFRAGLRLARDLHASRQRAPHARRQRAARPQAVAVRARRARDLRARRTAAAATRVPAARRSCLPVR